MNTGRPWRFRAFLLLIAGCGLFGAEVPIGIAKVVRGDVAVVRASVPQPCTVGMSLLKGDRIRTQSGASAGIILLDGTRLSVGEDSEVTLQDFLFQPEESKLGLTLQVLRGILTYVSGKIARLSPESVVIQTPVGMIGTRGTALATKIEAGRP